MSRRGSKGTELASVEDMEEEIQEEDVSAHLGFGFQGVFRL